MNEANLNLKPKDSSFEVEKSKYEEVVEKQPVTIETPLFSGTTKSDAEEMIEKLKNELLLALSDFKKYRTEYSLLNFLTKKRG